MVKGFKILGDIVRFTHSPCVEKLKFVQHNYYVINQLLHEAGLLKLDFSGYRILCGLLLRDKNRFKLTGTGSVFG